MNDDGASNLPAQIADALSSVAKAMVPGTIKALDRLVGAAIDVPIAKLEQMKTNIDAQTESYKLVERAIAQTVAAQAGVNSETAKRAMDVLVRKEYRKQINREAVAIAMVEDLREHTPKPDSSSAPPPAAELDEDWLNVFERYAEDASSERLQGLWGRVLAGEIRRPGRFSARTLRFLSEFSQADALIFENLSKCSFGDIAPWNLVVPSGQEDIGDLMHLEASGLILGSTGIGLYKTWVLGADGFGLVCEGELGVLLKGKPNLRISRRVVALTPLGQELLCLVPSRDKRESARAVASALRGPDIHEAYLGPRGDGGWTVERMEVLWMKEDPASPIVEGAAK